MLALFRARYDAVLGGRGFGKRDIDLAIQRFSGLSGIDSILRHGARYAAATLQLDIDRDPRASGRSSWINPGTYRHPWNFSYVDGRSEGG